MGRPPAYKTAKDLQTKIDDYFELCKPEPVTDSKNNAVLDKSGRPVFRLNPPNITGLALHLGFESRQSMYDYEKKEVFSYTIKKARLMCENYVERGLLANELQPASGIFILKNYGWSDRQEVGHDISKLDELLNGLRNLK